MMMKKENFSKAMNEMFGVGSDSKAAPAPETPLTEPAYTEPVYSEPAYADPPAPAYEEPAYAESAAAQPSAPAETEMPGTRDIFAAASSNYTAAPSFVRPSSQTTILAPGTTFVGNMSAKGDVDMDCEFQGDIEATGAVTLRTRLTGDLRASVVELLACEVEGDVHATESVRIDSKSKVVGNIFSKELICAGGIEGNVQVTGHMTVNGSAYIQGDISAGTVSIETGAGINGQMQVHPLGTQR